MIGHSTVFRPVHPAAALTLLLGFCAASFGQQPRSQHALLVGCTVYPKLDKRFHLEGPANDVVLLKELLVARFGFAESNVTVLADHIGQDSLPTRANIERQWRRLAEIAQPGDQILVMMAGHGTQSPQAAEDEHDPEADGLDEVFLPRDVGAWNDQVGEVENAIKDDDIRKWIAAITDKGASLWVIIDACHSGTMSRGADDEVKREVTPETLGVPDRALKRAQATSVENGASTAHEEHQLLSPEKTRGLGNSTGPDEPAVVALYASQSIEPTIEKRLPISGDERKYYGLLTYTLGEVLSQAASKLTYRELVAQIHRKYVKMGRMSPTPVLEGTAIDREVLGLDAFPERSRIVLRENDFGDWEINAGALAGMTKDSILALYPPAGAANADQILGHVRIPGDGLETLHSIVEPCAYNGMPSPADLKPGMRAETVYVDYGDQRMTISADEESDAGEKILDNDRELLESSLRRFAGQNPHLVRVVSGAADWRLRFDSVKSKQLFLVPGTGWQGQGEDDKRPPLFGPAPAGDKLASWLHESVTRIARAQALLRVSSQGIEETSDLDIQIVRYADRRDREGKPVEFGRGEVRLYDGDPIAFRVENVGFDPLDVTILLIDGGYGIHTLFPEPGQSNRMFTDDKRLIRGRINAKTTGTEHLVVIAVKGRPVDQPVNFSFLSQPTLDRTRDVSKGKSPLRDLLTGVMFEGQERTRGFASDEASDHQLHVRSWKTMPGRRKD